MPWPRVEYNYFMAHAHKLKSYRVLVADAHPIVLEGIKQVLRETPDLVIGGHARTGEEVLSKVRQGGWDVLVLDFRIPGRAGLDLIRQIKRDNPKLPVLILSMHAEDQFAVPLLKGGASGYITKESAPDELVKAIRKVCSGGTYISAQLAEQLTQPPEQFSHHTLSVREHEVLCRIGEGQSVTDIAEALALSVKTVSTYRARVLDKMRLKSTADLIRYALKHRLVE
ncbi:MAG: response regulator transcription factor [Nitrospirales bacterium]|nr:response regulator transcription factor [Nitrospirales bacterium]